MSEEKLMKYEARDGNMIELTFDMVRSYLVSGKSELVTDKEIMYFAHICKSKGLNPLKKDCYLIKFSADPAAVVTSIDFLRSRAKANPTCRGWNCGIIVKDSEGKIKYTNGLLLDGETLVGGWAEAKPVGWEEPMTVEVNLKTFAKKNAFWHVDKQSIMIQKVAESQLLRKCWPDETQGLYTSDEITQNEPGYYQNDTASSKSPSPLNEKLGIIDVESEEIPDEDEPEAEKPEKQDHDTYVDEISHKISLCQSMIELEGIKSDVDQDLENKIILKKTHKKMQSVLSKKFDELA